MQYGKANVFNKQKNHDKKAPGANERNVRQFYGSRNGLHHHQSLGRKKRREQNAGLVEVIIPQSSGK